jgi:hypothetical protein
MKFICNIDASKADVRLVLQVIRDNMDFAEEGDTIRLYMRDNDPNGVIIEERYDENDNLVHKQEH